MLAAGFGTRLRPLTHHRPKPLCPVLGVPILEQALDLCRRHGLLDLVVNAHHLASKIQDFMDREYASGPLRVHVQVELPEILGTGGGLRRALERLHEHFVVVNGDILCDADLGALLGVLSPDALDRQAVMLLRSDPEAARYGVVARDSLSRVVRLVELASLASAEPVGLDTHFTGIHALRRRALLGVPAQGASCIVRTVYRELVPQGRVGALLHQGDWIDVGNPQEYLRANLDALSGRLVLGLDPWARAGFAQRDKHGETTILGHPTRCDIHPSARLMPPFWIGQGAVIEQGAVVGPSVVVGGGARVRAQAHIERCVVWDGAQVPRAEHAENVIFHDGGACAV